MINRLLVILTVFVLIHPQITYGQNEIENRSEGTLDMSIQLTDKESNKSIKGMIEIYLGDTKKNTISSNSEQKLSWKLHLQKNYKIIVTSNDYRSKVLMVDTRMPKPIALDNKYGWEFPIKMSLEKDNNKPYDPLITRIYYNSDSSFFDYDKEFSTKKEIIVDEVMTVVDKMPEFKGGESELFFYLARNTSYPQKASDNGIEGTVYINFVVDKEGMVKDARVIKGTDPLLDTEALRVVEAMPNWNPGEHKGKKVSVSYNLPMRFKKGKNAKLPPEISNYKNYLKGVSFFERGYYKKAIKMFSLSLSNDPKHIDSYYNRGMCYLKTRKMESACNDWSKAQELGNKGVANLLDKYCQ